MKIDRDLNRDYKIEKVLENILPSTQVLPVKPALHPCRQAPLISHSSMAQFEWQVFSQLSPYLPATHWVQFPVVWLQLVQSEALHCSPHEIPYRPSTHPKVHRPPIPHPPLQFRLHSHVSPAHPASHDGQNVLFIHESQCVGHLSEHLLPWKPSTHSVQS